MRFVSKMKGGVPDGGFADPVQGGIALRMQAVIENNVENLAPTSAIQPSHDGSLAWHRLFVRYVGSRGLRRIRSRATWS